MDTAKPITRSQEWFYLATLGRDALVRELAPYNLPASSTYDPLSLATACINAEPIGHPEAYWAAQQALAPLRTAHTFTGLVNDEDDTREFTGIVPVLEERQAGDVTGWYAELLLFQGDSLLDKAAYRLSRMPDDRTWIIDSDVRPSNVYDGVLQPFGSQRLGRKRTLLPPFVAQLDRLIAQGPGSPA